MFRQGEAPNILHKNSNLGQCIWSTRQKSVCVNNNVCDTDHKYLAIEKLKNISTLLAALDSFLSTNMTLGEKKKRV